MVMIQRVRRRVDDMSAQVFPDAEILTWLSEALRDIASRAPDISLPGLCTSTTWGPSTSYAGLIVAAQSAYALPSDFLRDRGLFFTSSGKLGVWAERIAFRAVKRVLENENPSGGTKPFYYLWGGSVNLVVGTVGSGDSFEFYYVKQPPDYEVSVNTSGVQSLVPETGALSDTVDPTVSRHYTRAMEEFAVSRCYEVRRNYEMAVVCMKNYEMLLAAVAARYIVPGDPADQTPSDGAQVQNG
jgi:hypothetical protein